MSIIKKIARSLIYPSVTAFGLEKAFSALSKNNKLILVYHGVVNEPNHSISVGPISTKQFHEHLLYFRKHFDVVPLEYIFEMDRAGIQPKRKTIAITFDDGYQNNYSNAFPLLEELKMPATIFVVSHCLEAGKAITWYDLIDLAKNRLDIKKVDFSAITNSPPTTFEALKGLLKGTPPARRDNWLSELTKGIDLEDCKKHWPEEHWKLLNAPQMQEMVQSGLIEIGAHSHNHPNLGLIPPELAKIEIETSKHTLESAIETTVKSFAFPDGSYTNQVKKLCLAAGFTNLLAVEYLFENEETDKSILPRYCISSTTTLSANIIQVNKAFSGYGF